MSENREHDKESFRHIAPVPNINSKVQHIVVFVEEDEGKSEHIKFAGDLETDFVKFFRDAQRNAVVALDESPLREQAMALMANGWTDVLSDEQAPPVVDEQLKRAGQRVARWVSRVLDGRNAPPVNAAVVAESDWCCRGVDKSVERAMFGERADCLTPATDEEYDLLKSTHPRLLHQMQSGHADTVKLRQLNIGSQFAMKFFAEYIWRTPNLTSLFIDHVEGFADGDHGISIAHAIANHPNLRVVTFRKTDGTEYFFAALAVATFKSKTLENVCVSHSCTKDLGALFWALALSRKSSSKLSKLELSHCGITKTGATALALGLRENRHVKHLNLKGNRVSRLGCTRLGEAMLHNPILEDLNLSANAIGSRGCTSLAAFLLHPNCRLMTLDVSTNDIGPRGGKAIVVALASNKSLRVLNIYQNDLGDDGTAGFGAMLEKNRCLRELILSDNDMTDIGCAAVALGLRTNETLIVLGLAHQVIRDAGTEALATYLSANQTLTTLHLEENSVGDRGAAALAEMLSKNTTLHELLLNDNEIGNVGGRALGLVLLEKQNRVLEVLDMSNNPIAREISDQYFMKAESRGVTNDTARIDVVAAGTVLTRGNLREFGVVVLRSKSTSASFALFLGLTSIIAAWVTFVSHVLVAKNQTQAAIAGTSPVVYAVLVCIFTILPFVYNIVMFSIPAKATDATLPVQEAIQEDWSSAAMLKQLHRARNTRCSKERAMLFVLNAGQMRVGYEIYQGWKLGIQTLELNSIRLSYVVLGSLPLSIIQLRIFFSAKTMTQILLNGGKIYVASPPLSGDILGDTSIVVLIFSICLSVLILAYVVSSLFEKKFVVLWKRTAMANEHRGMYIGNTLAFAYHGFHYGARALTITLATTMWGPLPIVFMIILGLSARFWLQWYTVSERKRAFAIVCYFVGGASWDTRFASRATICFEFLETLFAFALLWVDPNAALLLNELYPLAFQQDWILLLVVIGPLVLTCVLWGTFIVFIIIYFAFIERIRPYRDVILHVDLARAEELAYTPFEENQKTIRKRRMEKMRDEDLRAANRGRPFMGKDFLTLDTRTNTSGKGNIFTRWAGNSEPSADYRRRASSAPRDSSAAAGPISTNRKRSTLNASVRYMTEDDVL